MIIPTFKAHEEANKFAVSKLYQVAENENYDSLEEFFRWISQNYGLTKNEKMVTLETVVKKKIWIGKITQ